MENLERVVANLPNATYHAAAAKNLVDLLRDNPLSSMYDPDDYDYEEPVRMTTKVMFLTKPPESHPCFCFVQYDSRLEKVFQAFENRYLKEILEKDWSNTEHEFRSRVALMISLASAGPARPTFLRFAH